MNQEFIFKTKTEKKIEYSKTTDIHKAIKTLVNWSNDCISLEKFMDGPQKTYIFSVWVDMKDWESPMDERVIFEDCEDRSYIFHNECNDESLCAHPIDIIHWLCAHYDFTLKTVKLKDVTKHFICN